MTENPFEGALGGGDAPGGGFDMNALLQQAQQMQEQMVAAQQRLAETEVEGTVSGGTVSVKLAGDGELRAVDIKAGEFDGTSADDLADLGDMIVAAFRDAKSKVDELATEAFGPLAGGPPGADEPGGGQPPQLGF